MNGWSSICLMNETLADEKNQFSCNFRSVRRRPKLDRCWQKREENDHRWVLPVKCWCFPSCDELAFPHWFSDVEKRDAERETSACHCSDEWDVSSHLDRCRSRFTSVLLERVYSAGQSELRSMCLSSHHLHANRSMTDMECSRAKLCGQFDRK